MVRIAKEIYIGEMENLARILAGHVDAYSLSFGTTASILLMERDIGIRSLIDEIVGRNDTGQVCPS